MAEWQLDQLDEGSDEEDEGDKVFNWYDMGRTATIFLIDASKEMFDTPEKEGEGEGEEEEDPPFMRAIQATHATLMRKAVASSQDLVGMVLFNTRQTKNTLDYPGVYVLQELQRPSAENILTMEEIMKMDQSQFDSKFGQSDSASIHDALRTCQGVFYKCQNVRIGRSILLFTCRDNPHSRDEQRRKQAVAKVRDLKECRISLEILHMGANFDIDKFYKELVFNNTEDWDEDSSERTQEQRILADPTTRLEELMNRVTGLDNKMRASAKLTFTLAPGVDIAVAVYSVYRKAVKPQKQKLWKNTNEEVKVITKKYYQRTGELVLPSDIEYYRIHCNEKISFTQEQIRRMKSTHEPGMYLLGFKPRSFIQTDFYVRESHFIFPKEDIIKGSTKLFSALLERCLAREVVPLVRIVKRSDNKARVAALIPQQEVFDEAKSQVLPSGFVVYYLPYSDYFRKMKTRMNRAYANETQVDGCKKVLRKLHIDYSPDYFSNPKIETHWEIVKALALNRPSLEKVTDYTVPDNLKIEKRAGSALREFQHLVYSTSYDPLAKLPKPKTSSSAPKRVKLDPQTADVAEMLKMGQASKLTVPVLKSWLSARGVRVSGKKKPELLDDARDIID